VLRTPVLSPEYDTQVFGPVPKVDAVAVQSEADKLTVFAVNRDQQEHAPVEIGLRSLPALRVARHTYIGADDPAAANTRDAQDRIGPRTGADVPLDGGLLRVALPPLSWNMLRIASRSAADDDVVVLPHEAPPGDNRAQGG